MTNQNLAKFVHETLSIFRKIGGQEHYPPFDSLKEENKKLYFDVIDAIKSGLINSPEGVHDFWSDYAKNNIPNHPCIVDYEMLSEYEKDKDRLSLALVKSLVR